MKNEKNKIIEENIYLKHAYISDGTHKLKIDSISIVVIDEFPFVVLETESLFTDNQWEKFDKAVYNKFAESIAKDVRLAFETNSKVKIALVLNKIFGKDKVLIESEY